jgi:predicted membrane-bound spermidine synthase
LPDNPRASAQVRRQRALLLVLVFVGGLTSLGVEFAAARLLAPYFGTSLYIWGILIGLILIYLTAGYYLGGRLADRNPSPLLLYRLTAVAGFAVGLIPITSRPILRFAQLGFAQFSIGIVVGSLLAVILLFALPVVLLGFVSPFVIRLRIEQVDRAGNAAGAVYALSTLGSILGTFIPVFWLIPTFGTRPTIYVLAFMLLLVSVAGLWPHHRAYIALLVIVGVLAVLPQRGVKAADYGTLVYETESAYNYIQVLRDGTRVDLALNEGLAVHSIFDPTTSITNGPWDLFLLAPYFGTGRPPERTAIIGLAAGTIAKQYTQAFGPLPIDGVEIDPKIVEVGRRFFAMDEPNLHVVVQDGRYFLATTDERYDVIALDAYRQPYIPFYLTTREFFAEARRHLRPGGVVAVNAGRTRTDYRLVNALAGTLRSLFAHVYVIDTPDRFSNSLIYATDAPTTLEEFRERGQTAGTAPAPLGPVAVRALRDGNARVAEPGPVFTDDLAPVERLIDQIILGFIRGT